MRSKVEINRSVELLIAHGLDVNSTDQGGWTPLHQAVWAKRKDIAELLLAAGANVNSKDREGRTPLSYALRNNLNDMADLLRRHGATEDFSVRKTTGQCGGQ